MSVSRYAGKAAAAATAEETESMASTERGMTLSRRLRAHILAALTVDVIIIALSAVVALTFRTRLTSLGDTAGLSDVAQAAALPIMAGWVRMLALFGAYSPRHMGTGTVEYNEVLAASGTIAGLIGVYSYLAKFPLSRGWFLLMFGIGVPLLIIGRFALRRALKAYHRAGHWRSRVLIAGGHQHIDDVTRVLTRESWLGYEVVGALTQPHLGDPETPTGVPVRGHTDAVLEAVTATRADAVVFAEGSFPSANDFRRMAWELEGAHVQMIVVPGLGDVSASRVDVRPVGGLPLVYVESPQAAGASQRLKRVFDIVGAMLSLVLFSPLLLLTSLAIYLDDRGPVLFKQIRVGRDGREFVCFKFRSMVVDAEAKLREVAHLDTGGGVLFKAVEDPRITRPGRWIRRFSIDELPQLLNVLRGDMSLVGPRPPLPREVAQYGFDTYRRLRVKPGMTGLWQVSGRSDLDWDDTIRLDLYYVDNWSMLQDIQILLRTLRAVVGGRGAY